MSILTEIKYYDVLPGTEIKQAILEAIKKAIEDKCIIRFNFNGVKMEIFSWSNVEFLEEYYYKELKENAKNLH